MMPIKNMFVGEIRFVTCRRSNLQDRERSDGVNKKRLRKEMQSSIDIDYFSSDIS